MHLYFEVDTANCFRKGINVDSEIVSIEVDPRDLPQADRVLIADHLKGNEVKQRVPVFDVDKEGFDVFTGKYELADLYVKAEEPTLVSLLTALRVEEDFNKRILTKSRTLARRNRISRKWASQRAIRAPVGMPLYGG